MERLASSEGKGIRAFFSPKSAEDAEKQRKEREKAFAEKKAQRDLQQSELQTIKESWGLQPFELESVVKLGRPSFPTVWKLTLNEVARRLAFGQVRAGDWPTWAAWSG